jgi:hypothetical protein
MMKNETLHKINHDLRNRYPGPHGPRYWLLGMNDDIVIRGWELVHRRDPEPMGKNLKVCRSIREALNWIDIHGR